MSSSAWLPPLNSHDSYETIVSFHLIDRVGNYSRKLTEDAFLIRVNASVQFTSSTNKKIAFPGLNLKETFYILRRRITSSSSSSEAERILKSIRSYMRLPFELDHIIFQQKDSGTSDHINSIEDLAAIIQNFLYNMKSKTYSDLLPFCLEIVKSVVISDDEYDTWKSWYIEKRNADPRFVEEYKSAISRTRTDEELLQESINQALASKSKGKTSTTALKNARINSHVQCLICLEELPPLSESTCLPCNHAFHEDCILKWLQERNTCPSCRFLLSSN